MSFILASATSDAVVSILTAFLSALAAGLGGYVLRLVRRIHADTNSRLQVLDAKLEARTTERDALQRTQDLLSVPVTPPPVSIEPPKPPPPTP